MGMQVGRVRGYRAVIRFRARDWRRTFSPFHVFGGWPVLGAAIPTSRVSGRALHLTLDLDLADPRLADLAITSVTRLAVLVNGHVEASREPLYVRHLDGGHRLEILGEPESSPSHGLPDELPQLPLDLEELSEAEAAVTTCDEFPDDHGPLHQVGGHPVWMDAAVPAPPCPITGKPMSFVAAVDSMRRFPLGSDETHLVFGNCGMQYVYWSDRAAVSATFAQWR
jgi:hypothetical protein